MFEKVRDYFETNTVCLQVIMLISVMLGWKCVTTHSSWDKLRNDYYKYYRNEIMEWYHIETNSCETGRIPVRDEDFLISLFAALKQNGELEDCTYRQLAEQLHGFFQLKRDTSAIYSNLKKFNENSVYFAYNQSFINKIKKMR